MRYHLYRSVGVIIMRIAGNIILIAGLVLSPILLIGIPKTLYNLVMNPEAVREGTFGVIFVAAFLLLFGAVFPNLFPNLAVDDKGLYVRFYIKWLFVPWQDVVSCQESFISALNPFSQHIYFVLAKRGLTPIHWLISLNQLGGWGPGFLISKNITDYQDLARTIREHLDSNWTRIW